MAHLDVSLPLWSRTADTGSALFGSGLEIAKTPLRIAELQAEIAKQRDRDAGGIIFNSGQLNVGDTSREVFDTFDAAPYAGQVTAKSVGRVGSYLIGQDDNGAYGRVYPDSSTVHGDSDQIIEGLSYFFSHINNASGRHFRLDHLEVGLQKFLASTAYEFVDLSRGYDSTFSTYMVDGSDDIIAIEIDAASESIAPIDSNGRKHVNIARILDNGNLLATNYMARQDAGGFFCVGRSSGVYPQGNNFFIGPGVYYSSNADGRVLRSPGLAANRINKIILPFKRRRGYFETLIVNQEQGLGAINNPVPINGGIPYGGNYLPRSITYSSGGGTTIGDEIEVYISDSNITISRLNLGVGTHGLFGAFIGAGDLFSEHALYDAAILDAPGIGLPSNAFGLGRKRYYFGDQDNLPRHIYDVGGQAFILVKK